MSAGLRPASAMAFSAASACSMICDISGTTPSLVVSAAPTTAISPGLIMASRSPGGTEQRQGALLVHRREGDLQRHLEPHALPRLLAVPDGRLHPRPDRK